MVKFLKFVLLVVIIAFAFALGVKFSDSFKGNLGNLKNDEIKVETEMNKAFESVDGDINRAINNVDEKKPDMAPLTDEERNAVNNTGAAMPEYVDIEIVEPMDGVVQMPANNQANPDMARQVPANPAMQPNMQPNGQPMMQPNAQPNAQPNMQPNGQPTMQPNTQPNMQPNGQPNMQPNGQPMIQPNGQPMAPQAVPEKK